MTTPASRPIVEGPLLEPLAKKQARKIWFAAILCCSFPRFDEPPNPGLQGTLVVHSRRGLAQGQNAQFDQGVSAAACCSEWSILIGESHGGIYKCPKQKYGEILLCGIQGHL